MHYTPIIKDWYEKTEECDHWKHLILKLILILIIIKTIIIFLLWKQRLLLAAQENYEFDCIADAHWLDNQIEIQTQHLWMTKTHWLCLPNSWIFLCQLTNEESAIQTRIVTRHPIRLGSKQFLLDVSEG